MRISDWSSDVCSSDLLARIGVDPGHVIQIVMLTIAMRQPGKYTQYAQVALQAYPFVSAMKVDEIGGNRQPGRFGGFHVAYGPIQLLRRSEERRGGKGCVSPCRSRGEPDH